MTLECSPRAQKFQHCRNYIKVVPTRRVTQEMFKLEIGPERKQSIVGNLCQLSKPQKDAPAEKMFGQHLCIQSFSSQKGFGQAGRELRITSDWSDRAEFRGHRIRVTSPVKGTQSGPNNVIKRSAGGTCFLGSQGTKRKSRPDTKSSKPTHPLQGV